MTKHRCESKERITLQVSINKEISKYGFRVTIDNISKNMVYYTLINPYTYYRENYIADKSLLKGNVTNLKDLIEIDINVYLNRVRNYYDTYLRKEK